MPIERHIGLPFKGLDRLIAREPVRGEIL